MDEPYLRELIRQANEKRLWERREWKNLIHYKPRLLLPGLKSLIDSGSFFLDPDGKTDPEAEMDSTLSSFFYQSCDEDDTQHPQCVFVARYQWLKQELDFDPDRLPEKSCVRFQKWIAALDPKGITLVFPEAYLNNPASMFGHSLIRIDTPLQREGTRLLDYTVSFAAMADDERGVFFALKGLSGGYPGKFFMTPYYEKVKSYGDIENRDIWEYRLSLTETEVRRMLMHVWELQAAHFDYFFIDENCSYHLLSLLEVARPSLNLTDRFIWWAVPADTIRALVEVPGLVTEVRYRPARSTVLRHRTFLMGSQLQDVARDLADKKIPIHSKDFEGLSPSNQAMVLELAAEYLAYQQESEFFDLEIDESHLTELLKQRSYLDVSPQSPRIDPPEVRPDQGHKSARIGVGYGYDDPMGFLQFDVRPVFHDLLDPQGGFIRGAQLEFLDTALRYYPDENKLELEQLRLIDIVSSTPRDSFLKPFSWKANAGLDRKRFADCDRSLVGELNGGIGVSYDFSRSKSLLCAFAEGSALLGGRFDENVALGAGLSLNIFHDLSRRWRIGLSGRLLEFFQGISRTTYDIVLSQRFTLGDQNALRLEVSRKREFGRTYTPLVLSWQIYF